MAGATFLQKQASFIWHTTMYDMIVQALQPCQLWCWSSHAIFESCLLETSPTDGGLLWKSSLDTTPNDRNPSGTFLLIRYFFNRLQCFDFVTPNLVVSLGGSTGMCTTPDAFEVAQLWRTLYEIP